MNFLQSDSPLSILGGSFGSGEILLIFVVVLLLFGSKNLPSIARSLGKALEEFRRAARNVSNEIVRADQPPCETQDSAGRTAEGTERRRE